MATTPWYVEAFQSDYRDVYAHRNVEAARGEVRWLAEHVLPRQGGPILDDCCGFGRHTLALLEAGYDVFGIDLSHDLLVSSRSLTGSQGTGTDHLGSRLARADMRALPFVDGAFAGLINLFTSFGYLGTEGDSAALSEMARVLRPGAVLVMDLMNPTRIRAGLRPSSREVRDGIVLEATRSLADGGRRVVKEVRLTLADGTLRSWREDVRMYEPDELDALFDEHGLSVTGRIGSFSGAAFEPTTSERQIVLATR